MVVLGGDTINPQQKQQPTGIDHQKHPTRHGQPRKEPSGKRIAQQMQQ
jgi:hypothetical protein